MKKIFVLALIVCSISCKKDSDIKTLKSEIAGTWELERFVGYPFDQPALPPGNGRIMVLREDGIFERRQHDSLISRGSYSLLRKKDCYDRSSDIILSINESSFDTYQYVEIAEGKLSLSTPNCMQDGGTAYYRRLK